MEIEAAKEALGKAVPDIDVYLDQGQLEIISYFHWYVNDGAFDSNRVLNGWVEKLNKALSNGYDGLRLTGNTFWLAKEDWEDFVDYEKDIDRVLGNYQMIALCTYNFDRCNSTETIDVVSNHKFALIKKKGEWEQIESSKLKIAEKVGEVLRLSNLYNRSLIEASLDPLVTIGPDGKITDVNEATEQVTGYSRDELIGTDFSDYFTEPEKAKKGYQEVFSVGFVYDYELAIQNKNGHITPVLYNASVYKYEFGDVIGVFAAARDITERKRMEAELEYIARLPWENPNPVIRLNQGHKTNYSNPAAQMLLTDWGCATSQEVPTEITKIAIAALNDGIQRKFEHKCANNTYILSLAPFPQSGYVNLYGRDITEQKKAEELLKSKLEELTQSNEELEQFAYASSHDLQEPLRMITSYLQLLQRKYQGNLDDKADKYIHFAVDGASRMQFDK